MWVWASPTPTHVLLFLASGRIFNALIYSKTRVNQLIWKE